MNVKELKMSVISQYFLILGESLVKIYPFFESISFSFFFFSWFFVWFLFFSNEGASYSCRTSTLPLSASSASFDFLV